ncbi:MAG: hypothetical protein ABI337_03875 [Nitrososphaera sp.]
MLKYFALMICLIGISFITDKSASACECKDLSEITPYLLDSDSIFLGKVTNIERINDDPTSYFVKFDVDKMWKGLDARGITIKASLNSGACGYPFELNQTLVIHASREGQILTEKGCGTLAAYYVADYIKYLDDHVGSHEITRVDPQALWDIHEVILDGTILDYNNNTWRYDIKVNQVFKGPTNFDLISAEGFDVWRYFKKGDRALFYLYDISTVSSNYKYKITDYSVKTNTNCDARSLIQISPVLPNDNAFVRGSHMIPWDYKDQCVPDYFSYDPDFWTFREYKPPLRQYQDHGLPINMQKCTEGLSGVILLSHTDWLSCVKPSSVDKLLERNVLKLETEVLHQK